MAYVIIGATGGLGRALAEQLAADGRGLILVARDAGALDALADGLRERHGITAATIAADVARDPSYLEKVSAAADASGGIEALLLPIGMSVRDGLDCPPETIRQIAGVNVLAAAEAVSGLWSRLASGRATVVGFGSVTAARGRGRNLVYGAMKRALQSYFESLRLVARGTPVSIQFWTLGFLDSDAMKDERTPLPKVDPTRLADRVVDALGHGSFMRHFPWWWAPVTLLLKHLPWALYRRIAGGQR